MYPRHGITDGLFGVSYANLGTLRKKIKVDHGLAGELWATGNHDARILATMVADPEQLDEAQLDAWVADLSDYVTTDAFAKVAATSEPAVAKMQQWTRADGEWIERAGWLVLAGLALGRPELPDSFFADYLPVIERDAHGAKNRVKDAMNSALIAIGSRSDGLEAAALEVAERLGGLDVDHGETGCKTPLAAAYIPKSRARIRKQEAKRAAARP